MAPPPEHSTALAVETERNGRAARSYLFTLRYAFGNEALHLPSYVGRLWPWMHTRAAKLAYSLPTLTDPGFRTSVHAHGRSLVSPLISLSSGAKEIPDSLGTFRYIRMHPQKFFHLHILNVTCETHLSEL